MSSALEGKVLTSGLPGKYLLLSKKIYFILTFFQKLFFLKKLDESYQYFCSKNYTGVHIHIRKAWHCTSVFLPGKSCGQRSLEVYSPQGHAELDMTEVTQHVHIHTKHITHKSQEAYRLAVVVIHESVHSILVFPVASSCGLQTRDWKPSCSQGLV